MQNPLRRKQSRKFSKFLLVLVLTPVLIGTNFFGIVADNSLSDRMRFYISLLLPSESVDGLNTGLDKFGLPTLPPHNDGTSLDGQRSYLDILALFPHQVASVSRSTPPTVTQKTPSVMPSTSKQEAPTTTTRMLTFTPSKTPTYTITPTETPTPGPLTFTPIINLICHDGPGVEYARLQIAMKDQPYLLDGRNVEGTWYRIMFTSAQGCWVAASEGITSGDTSGLRVIISPTLTPTLIPTNTPTFTPTRVTMTLFYLQVS